jgi:hypothetical protein
MMPADMKLVFLLQGRELRDQLGACDALATLQREGILSACEILPYRQHTSPQQWPAFWHRVVQTAATIEADVVFFQFFHGNIPISLADLHTLRNIPSRPTFAVSAGDAFGRFTRRIPRSLRLVSSMADVTFLTAMGGTADRLAGKSVRKILLMPHGYCQNRFRYMEPSPQSSPEFDVVFIGSCVSSRNVLSYHWRANKQREALVRALQKRYGARFGLFGHHWENFPSWQGPIPYHRQCEAYRRSRLAVGGSPGGFDDYYASDRPFIALMAGVPFLDHWVPRVDKILRDREHWFLYRNETEMLRLCDQLLEKSNADLASIAKRAADHCAAGHSQYHRNREMLQIVANLRNARAQNLAAPPPTLSFFLPEVDQSAEWPFASRNWIG